MTPMQKRVELLEKEVKYLKSGMLNITPAMDQLAKLLQFLDTNLTDEQKQKLLSELSTPSSV